MGAHVIIDETTPEDAFRTLESSDDSVLIDVRTAAEWDHIGVPDIAATGRPAWFIEWVSGPDRVMNTAFLEEVLAHADGQLPRQMLFICRSGARSASAAHAVGALAEHLGLDVRCTNVLEGFEGHPAAGPQSGWKARGLPFGGDGTGRGNK